METQGSQIQFTFYWRHIVRLSGYGDNDSLSLNQK